MVKSGRPQPGSLAVIGAGVSGLSCGIRLLEAGYNVEILAEHCTPDTTSDVAAAIWYPYLADPPEKVAAWAKTTFGVLETLAQDPETGVFFVHHHQIAPVPEDLPWWLEDGYRYAELQSHELPPGYRFGLKIWLPIMDTTLYMPFLKHHFLNLGGRIHEMALTRISQAFDYGETVVNCSGLGATELCRDSDLYPIRGRVLRVEKPDGVCCWADDQGKPTYILPRLGDCILGGSADIDQWGLRSNQTEARDIFDRCAKLESSLAGKKVLQEKVGLRPGRKQIRVCRERTDQGWIIHNYGHGGSGFTLSWGCAETVVDLVSSA